MYVNIICSEKRGIVINDENNTKNAEYHGRIDPENETNNYDEVIYAEESQDVKEESDPRPVNEPGYRPNEELQDSVIDSDYCLDTTVNQQTLQDMQIPVIANDGSLIGSGISFRDIAIKPSICESGSLAFFDGSGNLLAAALGSVAHLAIQDIVIRDDNVIRLKDYQFAWGKATRNINIDREQAHYFDNSNPVLSTPIVFPAAFVERPLVFVMGQGPNSWDVTGVFCDATSITKIRMTCTCAAHYDITFNWFAIGKWR
ncbi:MAG: hypothetical protein J5379_03490 [Clostridiales bacterium]|nr:hypothetical protein [Clostridiales bacterium]